MGELGWRSPVVTQTVYRITPPLSAGIDRHQDATFLYTEPQTSLGLLIALEKVDENNGCLHVRPGSHNEVLRERFLRNENDSRIELSFERLAEDSFESLDGSAFMPIAMDPGDLVILHG